MRDWESTPQSVTFSAEGLHQTMSFSALSCTPVQNPQDPSCTSEGTITTSNNTPMGDYQITIKGTSDNITRSQTITLKVGGTCQGTQRQCRSDNECEGFKCRGAQLGYCNGKKINPCGVVRCYSNDDCRGFTEPTSEGCDCVSSACRPEGECLLKQGLSFCSSYEDCYKCITPSGGTYCEGGSLGQCALPDPNYCFSSSECPPDTECCSDIDCGPNGECPEGLYCNLNVGNNGKCCKS
jgi:hypothetical protein